MRSALWFLLLILTLFPVEVYALPEIPANDYDDDSSGGDALIADGPDRDHDGYASDQDCDDTQWTVVPGEYYGCDAGTGANSGTRLCNSNGTWGTCTANSVTPLCEATGGGSCYYVDCASGNNSNAGTWGSPWADFQCVGYWASGAPGCHVNMAAGSVVYVKNATACATTYDPDGAGGNFSSVLFASFGGAPAGTSSNRTIIKGYPGSGATLDGPGTNAASERNAIHVLNSDYLGFVDLKLETGFGKPILLSAADNILVSRIFVNGYGGEDDNNAAGIYSNGGSNNTFSYNKIIDVTDPVDSFGDPSNIAAITIFNDDSGGGHSLLYNRLGYTADPGAAGNDKGNCIKFKHGAERATHSGNLVTGNICWNARNFGIGSFTSKVVARHNLFVKVGLCVHSGVEDQDTYLQDMTYEYNTCIDSAPINIDSGADGGADYYTKQAGFTIGPFLYQFNIFKDSLTSVSDSGGRGVRIDFYGNETQYASMSGRLTLDSNCYYNSALAYKWTYFGAGVGDNGARPSGASGFTTTTFATWQAAGFDASSLVQDPALDSSLRATGSCGNWGWRLTDEEEPEPTPTPTPTPTPSPTPTPEPDAGVGTIRQQQTFYRRVGQ